MFIFKGVNKADGTMMVFDDSDNTMSSVTYSDLKDALQGGTEVQGCYLADDGVIYDDWDESVADQIPEFKQSRQSNLTKAKKAKNDEFYTQLKDIELELSHYPKGIFKDKVIYLPTDVAITDGSIRQSQFVKYFQMHAHDLQYKKLIATCLMDKTNEEGVNRYIVTRRIVSYCTPENQAKSIAPIDEVYDSDGMIYYVYKDGHKEPVSSETVNQIILDETGKYEYEGGRYSAQYYDYRDNLDSGNTHCQPDENYGSGDFRSKECQGYFEEADIVITNPPFSLFREFTKTLFEHKCEFIIIGNMNAITFKEFFPYIKENKVYLGWTSISGGMWLQPAATYEVDEKKCKYTDKGDILVNVSGAIWFTTICHSRRNEPLILTQRYYDDPSKYPKYDNYDAINVDKTKDIPKDYFECIGVPISFLDKYNPEQFEIVGADFDLARPVALPDGKKGTGRFYVRVEREQAFIFPYSHSQTEEIRAILAEIGISETSYCSGVMGVPISFLDKYNPDQFEIVDANDYSNRKKATGLIKDADSAITTEREQNDLCENLHQASCHQELTAGTSEESANTQGYSFYVDYIFGKKSFKDFMTELLKSEYNVDIVSYCNGIMGVPISFLDKYSPEQFEIVGCSYDYGRPDGWSRSIDMNVSIDGKQIYKRILIHRYI